ncbi:MAG: tRNA (N6-threonylcarbamoyladenosine(37)-N6)-methyltransferase TrmO [Bacteroidales bacterium]|nr:tRNA (N6-threonylcarbamoyladenosine(37)-N6)-methyltransferase TrmO [Bacteroidales bacterium]
MTEITYNPIGIIHSCFKKQEGTPIQAVAAKGSEAVIEIFTDYLEGLSDLENFSHIYILYHLHLIKEKKLTVIPFLDTKPHGIFATRSPVRPNPIGLSVVCLEKISGNKIYIKNLDILDGTPVLDIKPYFSKFDVFETTRNGWLAENFYKLSEKKDDGRFR